MLRRLLVSYLALTLVECTGASFLRTHMLGDLSLALALLLAQAAAVAWAVLGHRRADADAEDAS